MVGPDAALGGRLGPVVVVAETNLGLGALADVPVLGQPVPLDLHVGLRLFVGDEKLVGASSGFPLSVKPGHVFIAASRRYQASVKNSGTLTSTTYRPTLCRASW